MTEKPKEIFIGKNWRVKINQKKNFIVPFLRAFQNFF